MTKTVCDITGNTPAIKVDIMVNGEVAFSIDMCAAERTKLLDDLRNKMKVRDLTVVMVEEK